jgi:lipopolysaccharide transport system permease protein
MRLFPLATEAFTRLYRNRALTFALAKREISDRYTRQMLGSAWAVAHPLIHVLVYIFVFQMVLKLRIETTAAMPMDYVAYLLAGLIPWLAVQEALTKGSTVITSNASLVKQVVFPLEVLPVKSVLVCFVTQGVGTICLAVYVLITNQTLPWTYCLLPVLWLFQALGMIGIVFVLSAVGVHVRDVKELVQVFAVVGIYLVPVVYLPEWVPDGLKWLLPINPFSHMVWCYQDVCYFGRCEHLVSWIIFPLETSLAFLVGYALFRRLRPFLGSAL